MSCIVGLVENDVVWIGCDSMSSDETSKLVRKDGKIFRVKNDAIIGFSGSYRAGQIIQYTKGLLNKRSKSEQEYLVTHFIPKIVKLFDKGDNDETLELECPFLLAFKDRLFQVDSDFQLAESAVGYDAVGGGAPYALGSLYSTAGTKMKAVDRVYWALKSAEVHGMGIGAPFMIFNTKDDIELNYES